MIGFELVNNATFFRFGHLEPGLFCKGTRWFCDIWGFWRRCKSLPTLDLNIAFGTRFDAPARPLGKHSPMAFILVPRP
jgi:hypothetical protein